VALGGMGVEDGCPSGGWVCVRVGEDVFVMVGVRVMVGRLVSSWAAVLVSTNDVANVSGVLAAEEILSDSVILQARDVKRKNNKNKTGITNKRFCFFIVFFLGR